MICETNEDHTKWMNETHTKEGDKALLMLNWSIGPEFKDGNKTGNMSLILTEVYENQAGIDDHLHFHLVPRWKGDTNFMPVVGNTKVIMSGLHDTYDELFSHFQKGLVK